MNEHRGEGMNEEHTPTLKELRGLSLEELANRTGIPKELLERWEEIGVDAHPVTWEADFWMDNELSVVMDVLDADRLKPKFAPTSPEPGQLVIESPKDPALTDLLIQRAEELGLRVAVPTEKWGTVLKDARVLTKEDTQAIADYQEADAAHQEERLERIKAYLWLLAGHNEDTTVGEALDAAAEELERDLERLSEGEE